MVLKKSVKCCEVTIIKHKLNQKILQSRLLWDLIFNQCAEKLNDYTRYISRIQRTFPWFCTEDHILEDFNHFILKDYNLTA